MSGTRGIVYLVGAGPGDPGLITVRGMKLLRRADVVIHDRLIPRELLAEVREGATIIDAGKAPGDHKLTQDEVNSLIVEQAMSGRHVVRLKGGDPFVFGRGFEEWLACRDAGIECEVVPGVSSAIAAPAAADIPVTHRGLSRGFAVVTARTGESETADDLDYGALARMETLVVLMGRAALRNVIRGLLSAGMRKATPAACVQEGTTQRQRVVTGTLLDIAERADAAGLSAPMVLVVGKTARFASLDSKDSSTYTEDRDERAPLFGFRIVVTGSQSLNRKLRPMLEALGATVIECSMIAIRYVCNESGQSFCIKSVADYDWIIFVSVHGVRGFIKAMKKSGGDLRQLAGAKIAAVGRATATALEESGLRADYIPNIQTAASLVDELKSEMADCRVLLPCGDTARDELERGLSDAGAAVDRVIVYQNKPVRISDPTRSRLNDGFDAIVFASPSAARRFGELNIDTQQALVACIGPTTASAIRAMGRTPDIVPADFSVEGLVTAIVMHYQSSMVMS